MGRQIGVSEAADVAVARVVPDSDKDARHRRVAAIHLALLRDHRVDGALHRRARDRHVDRPSTAHSEGGDAASKDYSSSNSSGIGHEHFLVRNNTWIRPYSRDYTVCLN